jgi:hypothetical protein
MNAILGKYTSLHQKFNKAVYEFIAGVYGINKDNIELEIKVIGKQDGFIIKDKATGLRLFTKISRIFSHNEKSIDPRELFAYKVLEYMELGPKTQFIFIPGSSSQSRLRYAIM